MVVITYYNNSHDDVFMYYYNIIYVDRYKVHIFKKHFFYSNIFNDKKKFTYFETRRIDKHKKSLI